MYRGERGFTLIETVVAVAIVAILAASGGMWYLSMRPGALRASVDDFDSALSTARAIAASSGNGATIVVAPRLRGGAPIPGFVITVYSGRPTSAGAVTNANLMPVVSDASISEKTLGKPPFSIFLSSAGYPTGQPEYPTLDSQGAATFAPLAAQPACPTGGLVLTFANPRGDATDTRRLECNTAVAGGHQPNPSPTPNRPLMALTSPLRFDWPGAQPKPFGVSEFGYTHWFASDGTTCGNIAMFPLPYPYSTPPPGSNDLTLPPPPPPNTPYAYPNAATDDAPAFFSLVPDPNGDGGQCAVAVTDAYGATADERGNPLRQQVVVYGWLYANFGGVVQSTKSPSPVPVQFTLSAAGAKTIVFSKQFDNDPLTLRFGGSCGSLLAVTQAPNAPQQPSQNTLTLSALGKAGTCELDVADEYSGEPALKFPVTIANPQSMKTWPLSVKYAIAGGTLANSNVAGPIDLAESINTLFGGASAQAATQCPAIAYSDPNWQTPDTNNSTFAALGVTTDARGCYDGSIVAYFSDGTTTRFMANSLCQARVSIGAFYPGPVGSRVAIRMIPGAIPTPSCAVTVTNALQQTATLGKGIVNAQVAGSFKLVDGYVDSRSNVIGDLLGSLAAAQTGPIYDPAGQPVPGTPCNTYIGIDGSGSCQAEVVTGQNCGQTLRSGYVGICVSEIFVKPQSCSSGGCATAQVRHLVTSGPYAQIGESVEGNIIGYYHDPLLPTDLQNNWCQTVSGLSSPIHCDDYTQYEIPGVWYPTQHPTLP